MATRDQQQHVRTVWWEEDSAHTPPAWVCLLDQSLLPQQVVYVRLAHEQQIADAIKTLKVRGAPVIGVTAAFGMALALTRLSYERTATGEALSLDTAHEHLLVTGRLLCSTRPTAVNLSWAVERMVRCSARAIAAGVSLSVLVQTLQREAQAVAAEDSVACIQMGSFGAALIADGDTLLTHCNAGALATAGLGTALAPIYTAHQEGKRVHVFVDETRPVLQGARLTAWELQQEDVPLTLITDNMAGYFMRHSTINAVFVGADRIAANGDVANKIGTYSVAVLAHVHHIPVYVVAPCSTIDLSLPSGEQIPIEQRKPEEVTSIHGVPIAPAGIEVANPAFDVTPHTYISAIVTEKGIARPPYHEALRQVCAENYTTGKVFD